MSRVELRTVVLGSLRIAEMRSDGDLGFPPKSDMQVDHRSGGFRSAQMMRGNPTNLSAANPPTILPGACHDVANRMTSNQCRAIHLQAFHVRHMLMPTLDLRKTLLTSHSVTLSKQTTWGAALNA